MTTTIPDGQSPLRSLMSEAGEFPYTPLQNFKEAKKYDDAYVIMQGDDGGQIYLAVPLNFVKCEEAVLQRLLEEIDELSWKDPSMAMIYYERIPIGRGIPGGMGGGKTTNSLWVHERLESHKDRILQVIQGKRKSIKV